MKFSLRLLYLYLFTFVGLLISVIGSMRLVELGLKTWVFTQADKYVIYDVPEMASPEGEKIDRVRQQEIQDQELVRSRQRDLAGALAMVVVGVPLYMYHWRMIQKEAKEEKKEKK